MKFFVTPELAVLLKTLRTQNRVAAKDLANHIDKSYSYISKLESGEVKNINKDDLTQILTYITGGGDFYSEVLPNVYRTLKSFVDKSHMLEQLWLIQYDVMERTVTISEDMADEIKETFGTLNISPERFSEIINQNADSELPDTFPANEIIALDNNGVTRLVSRIFITKEQVENVLFKNDLRLRYNTLQSILFILFKLQKYPGIPTKLPPDEAVDVLKACAAIMEKYDVHSLMGYSHLISSEEYTSKHRYAVSSFKNIDENTVSEIVELLDEASKHAPMNAAVAMETFKKNLEWDVGFMFKMMEYKFYAMGYMSYTNKKNMAKEMAEILDKYSNLPDFEKKYDTY